METWTATPPEEMGAYWMRRCGIDYMVFRSCEDYYTWHGEPYSAQALLDQGFLFGPEVLRPKEIEALRELEAAVPRALALIDALIPGLSKIAMQDYTLLDAPVAMRQSLAKLAEARGEN